MSKPEKLKGSRQRSKKQADKTPQRSTRQRAQAKAAASVTAPEHAQALEPVVGVPRPTSTTPRTESLTNERLLSAPLTVGMAISVASAVFVVCGIVATAAAYYVHAEMRESIHQVELREIRPLREEVIRLRADAR